MLLIYPFLETPDENTDIFEGGDEAIEPKIDLLKDRASNSAALEEKVWGDSRATVKTELFMNDSPVTREILEEHENTPIKVYIKIEASSLKGRVIWESIDQIELGPLYLVQFGPIHKQIYKIASIAFHFWMFEPAQKTCVTYEYYCQ